MNIENRKSNCPLATMAWGALLIWWGISILVGPITIGMSAVGTGLILVGVNAIRALKGIPFNNSNYSIGMIAIVWGALDHTLALSFWTSFATLLIVIGIMVIGSMLIHRTA
jgi:hypothetical protein